MNEKFLTRPEAVAYLRVPRNFMITRKDVEAQTGLCRSSIYKRVIEGTFPPQIKVGKRSVRWLQSEIDAWISRQIDQSRAGNDQGAQK